jgi:hypothetical protein
LEDVLQARCFLSEDFRLPLLPPPSSSSDESDTVGFGRLLDLDCAESCLGSILLGLGAKKLRMS